MTTEEPRVPHALEHNSASYVDTLTMASASRRATESEFSEAPSVKGERNIPDEPMNWAEFIDRIYIQELMRRLNH
jgi:hypothetical protein